MSSYILTWKQALYKSVVFSIIRDTNMIVLNDLDFVALATRFRAPD